jgi:peptidoglycan/LPS O-acetylase OafA/YrhL
LQTIVGQTQMSGFLWTLCLEVQFYLAQVVVVWATAVVLGERRLPWVVFGLAAAAVAAPAGVLGPTFVPPKGAYYFDLFPGTWYMFLAGCTAWLAVDGRLPAVAVAAFAAVIAAVGVWQTDVRCVAAGVTTLAVIGVGVAGRLDRLLHGPVLQYLGRTSYSLYLVHCPVGVPICYFGRRVFGSSPAGGVITFLVALAAVLVATHLMYRLVEQPSVRWSQRLKPGPAGRGDG